MKEKHMTTNEIDEWGATKLLTPEIVRAALGLVKKGKIYSSVQVLEPGMPQLPRHPPLVVAPSNTPYQSQRRWQERGAKNLPGAASERVEINTHSGHSYRRPRPLVELQPGLWRFRRKRKLH